MGFQDKINAEPLGRTWRSGSDELIGVGRCLMGPIARLPNPHYPRATTYATPTPEAIREAEANSEQPTMDIVQALFEFDDDRQLWRCTLGACCGKFPRSRSSWSSDQASCTPPQLPT